MEFDKTAKEDKFVKGYKIITGEDLLTITEDESTPIIEGIVYPGDIVLIVAPQKHGKSLIVQHMTCNISQGNDFLDTFSVPNKNVVLYLATEGNETENKERFISMRDKLGIAEDDVFYVPAYFKLNQPDSHQQMRNILMDIMPRHPTLVIIDSLYSSVKGSLTKDDVCQDIMDCVRNFAREVEMVSGFRPGTIILHHMKKKQRDKDGKNIKQDGSDLYGSYTLGAAVNHIFTLEKHNSEHKHYMFKCVDQRSGKISESIRIKLYEPDPLYFQIVSTHYEQKADMLKLLHKHHDGLTKGQIIKKLKISKSLYYIVRKEIEDQIDIKIVDRKAIISLKT